MFRKAIIIKLVISLAIVAYFIHPLLPTIGSLVWLWVRYE